MKDHHRVSERQGCAAMSIARSTYRYTPKQKDDSAIIEALLSLVEQFPSIGFGLCMDRLRLQGKAWNHKRVYRVYRALGLSMRRRARRRLPARVKHHLYEPTGSSKP